MNTKKIGEGFWEVLLGIAVLISVLSIFSMAQDYRINKAYYEEMQPHIDFCEEQGYDGANRVVAEAGFFYEYRCYKNYLIEDIKKEIGDDKK